MMRKLAAITASLLIGTQMAWADGFLGLGKITADGSLEVLGQQANNETDFAGGTGDHRGDTVNRLTIGLGFPELTEGVSGRIEVVRNPQSAGTVNQFGGGAEDVGDVQFDTQIQNAYVNITNFFYTDQIRLGRQYDGRPGDLLLYHGHIDNDQLTVSAIDAVVAKKKVGPVDGLFGTGKLVENDAVPGVNGATDAGDATGDINLTYLILSSGSLFQSIRLPLELGWYQINNANATTNPGGPIASDNQSLQIYDLRAKYGFMNDMLWVSGEYAQNGGQDNNNSSTGQKSKYKGSAYIVKADYAGEGFGLKAVYANASGQDQNTATWSSDKSFHDGGNFGASSSDFAYGEILTGSMNNLAATTPPHLGPAAVASGIGGHRGLDTGDLGVGLNVIGLGGNISPANWMNGKLNFMLDFYTVKANKVVTGGDKKVGTEFDLAVKYRHSDMVSATAGYAMLSPGDGFANGFAPGNRPTDKVTKFFAKVSLKWGTPSEDSMAAAPMAMKATHHKGR